MKVGIDKIGLGLANYYVDLKDLANKRNVDPNKYILGLLQEEMSVTNEDVISLAYKASIDAISKEDIDSIDYLIVGTESGIDNSKSIASVLHKKLNLNEFTRSIEVKQACYGATASIQIAKEYIKSNPEKKVLVVAVDIAKYGKNTGGEPTQGAGAVAMLISKDPKIVEILDENVCYTLDVWDFYRPNNSEYAVVDGKLSVDTYMDSLKKVYNEFKKRYDKSIKDFEAMCFHIPYSKLGYKGLKYIEELEEITDKKYEENFLNSIKYNKRIGNIYTGSIFLSLLSLLTYSNIKENKCIGMYSYGSGAVSEIFLLKTVKGYKDHILFYESELDNRKKLTVEEYEKMFFKENGNDEKNI